MQWADRTGRTLDLVRCAWEHNQGNAGLAALWTEAQGWGLLRRGRPLLARLPPLAPSTGHHVFLAYSRQDSDFMQRLRNDLRAAGIIVWIDEEDLEPGTTQWQPTIQLAIRGA